MVRRSIQNALGNSVGQDCICKKVLRSDSFFDVGASATHTGCPLHPGLDTASKADSFVDVLASDSRCWLSRSPWFAGCCGLGPHRVFLKNTFPDLGLFRAFFRGALFRYLFDYVSGLARLCGRVSLFSFSCFLTQSFLALITVFLWLHLIQDALDCFRCLAEGFCHLQHVRRFPIGFIPQHGPS